MNWTVQVLDTGSSTIEKSIITYLTDAGKPIRVARLMFLLRGEATVLVDTSVRDQADAEALGENLLRTSRQEPSAALRAAGVAPEDVNLVILSHLHWDHTGNNHLFPNARFLVQRSELAYAYVPGPMFERFFMAPQAGMQPRFSKTHFDLLEGDASPLPGLEVLHVPGHTPGSQAVLVHTREGRIAIAGDAIYTYENLDRQIAPGVHCDVDESLRAMRRIKRCSDLILPSHDVAVLERFGDRALG